MPAILNQKYLLLIILIFDFRVAGYRFTEFT